MERAISGTHQVQGLAQWGGDLSISIWHSPQLPATSSELTLGRSHKRFAFEKQLRFAVVRLNRLGKVRHDK
jgi:hypothetical protein